MSIPIRTPNHTDHDLSVFHILISVMNSTYQPNEDANGSVEEDILYQSDASFGAKLDNSKSRTITINHKINSNSSSQNTNTNTNNKKANNNERSNHIRYQNSVNKSSVKHRVDNIGGTDAVAANSKLENSESGRSNADKIVANKFDDDDHKTNVNVNPIDSNLYDDNADDVNGDDDDDDDDGDDDAAAAAATDDDINYDGDKISASESIVIKLGSKSTNSMKKGANTKPKSSAWTPTTKMSSTTKASTVAATSTMAPIIMNSFNDDYYSKDDMSVYDDVNNNRLNLRNANGHVNAYEQRNIYVANELSDGTSNANDSVKSYIHIEVYKGNLDDLTTDLRTITTTAATTPTAPPSTTKATVKPDVTSEP